jgi:hypothetical protein
VKQQPDEQQPYEQNKQLQQVKQQPDEQQPYEQNQQQLKSHNQMNKSHIATLAMTIKLATTARVSTR